MPNGTQKYQKTDNVMIIYLDGSIDDRSGMTQYSDGLTELCDEIT
jgi:hypothetical protein